VQLDAELATLYGVTTKRLNEQPSFIPRQRPATNLRCQESTVAEAPIIGCSGCGASRILTVAFLPRHNAAVEMTVSRSIRRAGYRPRLRRVANVAWLTFKAAIRRSANVPVVGRIASFS
jgi:hypothetical protein